MARAPLTVKQNKILEEMSPAELIAVINALVDKNKEAKTKLVNQFLTSPKELLQTLKKRYQQKARSKRFYDYYQSDEFFHELCRDVVAPLSKTVHSFPAETEALTFMMLDDFPRLCETKDTSSGSWFNYHNALVDFWFKSLGAQPAEQLPIMAEKMVNYLLNDENHLHANEFKKYRAILKLPFLRMVRDLFVKKNKKRRAIDFSLLIHDLDFLDHYWKKKESFNLDQTLDYADLVIDELQPEKALKILEQITADQCRYEPDYKRWQLLKIQAIAETGDQKAALQQCLMAFAHFPLLAFYQAHGKLVKMTPETEQHFIHLAKIGGTSALITFLYEAARFDLLSEEILQSALQQELAQITSQIGSSGTRKLSTDLSRNGYHYPAALLRREIAEKLIEKAQSQYYHGAASDLKKSLDYSLSMETEAAITEALTYFTSLYEKHHRKSALWQCIQDKITALSMTKGHFSINKE